MITTHGASAAQHKHLEALRAKHEALDSRIRNEQKSPAVSTESLRDLKLQKLRVKEEMEDIRSTG